MTCPVWQNSYYIFKISLQTELLQWSRQVTLKANCQRRSIRQRMNPAVGKMSPGYQSLLNMRGIRVTSLNFEVLQSQLAFDSLWDNSTSLHIANKVLGYFPSSTPLIHFIIHLVWFEPHPKTSSPCILLLFCRADGGKGAQCLSNCLLTTFMSSFCLMSSRGQPK